MLSKAFPRCFRTTSTRFNFCNAMENSPPLYPHLHYYPPSSKLQEFSSYINQIEEESLKNKAAEMLGTLEADQNIYKTKIDEMQEQLNILKKDQPQAVEIVLKRRGLQQAIRQRIEENKAIQQRCHRDLENIKIYGVSKLAKQFIQIADHLALAISALQNSNDKQTLQSLTALDNSLQLMLHKYEIYPYDPVGQPFDPNFHQSYGHVPNQDPSKSNFVAETHRRGWKIRDRLLRHATVLIYQ